MNTLNETLVQLSGSIHICHVATHAFDTVHLSALPKIDCSSQVHILLSDLMVSTRLLFTWVPQQRIIAGNVKVARIGSMSLKAAEFLLSH